MGKERERSMGSLHQRRLEIDISQKCGRDTAPARQMSNVVNEYRVMSPTHSEECTAVAEALLEKRKVTNKEVSSLE